MEQDYNNRMKDLEETMMKVYKYEKTLTVSDWTKFKDDDLEDMYQEKISKMKIFMEVLKKYKEEKFKSLFKDKNLNINK